MFSDGDTLTIERWEPSSPRQEERIRAFGVRNGYARSVCTPEFFDWKFRQNPAGPAVIELLVDAAKSGELVGQFMVLPVELTVRAEAILAGVAVNVIVEPAYRGTGAFPPLARRTFQTCANKGIKLTYAYPNPQAHLFYVKFLQFTELGEAPLLIRVLDLGRVVAKKFPVERLRNVMGSAAVLGNAYYRPRPPRDLGVEVVTDHDAAFDELNCVLGKRFPAMVSRHAAYLNWRYQRGPFDYRVLAVRKGTRVEGYLAYRVLDFADMRCAMICDFVLRGESESPSVGRRLVRAALAKMAEEDCEVAGALMVAGHVEYDVLRTERFYVCPRRLLPQPFALTLRENVKGSGDCLADMADIKNWFVSIGDYDAA